jgi:lysozyme
MIVPVVADLNHANSISFTKVKAAGILGIIHKATEGTVFRDPAYKSRRSAAEAMGFLWGAYDFARGDDVMANVETFMAYAAPGPQTLMCLDFEDNAHSEMSAAQAREFLDRVDQKLGRACWIYGGNRIHEHVPPDDEWWAQHPLWLCQYSAAYVTSLSALNQHINIPKPWTRYTLLQYTGDGYGPKPHTVNGLEAGADLNAFDGTDEELIAVWPGKPLVQAAVAQT